MNHKSCSFAGNNGRDAASKRPICILSETAYKSYAGGCKNPNKSSEVLAQMIKLIGSFKLTWCIFLMVPFLCHCITVFTHVILEEAKCLLGLTGVENHSG